MSVLTVVSVLTKDRAAWQRDLLINGDRVSFFHKDASSPSTKTVMRYRIDDFERGKTWELTLNNPLNTVATRLMEDETNPVIKVDVEYIKPEFGKEKPVDAATLPYEICAANVKYAYNVGTTHCYVFMNEGLNTTRLKLSHTIQDLSRAFSQSQSLSAS